jgi:hypothetical protein
MALLEVPVSATFVDNTGKETPNLVPQFIYPNDWVVGVKTDR